MYPVTEYALERTGEILKIDFLKKLKRAPNFSCEFLETGFHLTNDNLHLSYYRIMNYSEHKSVLELSYSNPKVSFIARDVNMTDIPESIICSQINLIIEHVAGGANLYRFPSEGEPDGKEEWYDYGTKLLQRAAKQYDLKKHYGHHVDRTLTLMFKKVQGLEESVSELRDQMQALRGIEV